MNDISYKEFLMKSDEEFTKKCIGIFKKYAPDMSYLTMKAIICDIAGVRADMEREHSMLLLDDIEQILKGAVVKKNG